MASFIAIGQVQKPFLAQKFDKVIMYDFEGGKGIAMRIVEKEKLVKTIRKQIQLDSHEISQLNIKLCEKLSYGGGTASCFDPHLGFVYFFEGKIVGYITICLDCNRLYSSIDIPAQKQGKHGDGKNVEYTADGLSKSFRKFLNELLKKYGYSHQIPKGSSFD
jgi:hypothetical protein